MSDLVVLNPIIKQILNKEDKVILARKIIANNWNFTDSMPGIIYTKMAYKAYFDWIHKAANSVYSSNAADNLRKKCIPVIDGRCPYVRNIIGSSTNPLMRKRLADIYPILINGAIARNYEFKSRGLLSCNDKLLVIAPCDGFKKYNGIRGFKKGNKILVYTWKEFKNVINFHPKQKTIKSSPVPLGFFDDLGVKVYGASGEKDCRELLKNHPADAELLELLWCQNGCHNGDGLQELIKEENYAKKNTVCS